ncbi:MAG: malate/lactate/ureidoglycolate dehydrogenase [Pseudomonadota bacterium]|nr:malate/lactate/ureidoglycolate dehydrogenase [Pseudomonadota bacterium]
MTEPQVFDAARLASAVAAIVRAGGSADAEAAQVAANLVEANLRGHDSHGVGMVPRYIDAILEGGLAVNSHVAVRADSGSLLTLDGQHGYGQVIGAEAMAMGIERARQHGVCVIGLAHSHHLGRIGHWAEQCIDAGLVSIHFVNVLSRPVVAPFGGRDARLGTNPFCVGIPRPGHAPIVLDFATSKIAQGKTRVAFNKGLQLEPGTIIDDHGDPTTDPRYTVIEPTGAILPFGEHKGAGLALICELLGGALAGGATAGPVSDGRRRVLNSMFSILVDPEKLGTAANLAQEMESYVAWATASPPAVAGGRVRTPGEPEREMRAARMATGVPIDAVTWAEIVAAGHKVGLTGSEVDALAR